MFSALRFTSLVLVLALPTSGQAAPARERAIEQIPELMGRILDSQEEIRERETEMMPVIERYNAKLSTAKTRIDASSSEQGAAEGAPFIESMLIDTPKKAFDDFAGADPDEDTNQEILGIKNKVT